MAKTQIPKPRNADRTGTHIQAARYAGWEDASTGKGFNGAKWLLIGNQQTPKCGTRLQAAYKAAHDWTMAEMAKRVYLHEGGKGGDEQMVYYAVGLKFQCDPAKVFHRSTVARAKRFLEGLNFRIVYP